MKKHPGGQPSKNLSADSTGSPPRREDLGITRDQPSQWQAEASVPEPVFEAAIEEAIAEDKPLTTAGMVKVAKEEAKKEQQQHAADVMDVLEREAGPFGRRA
jgi:hypothetical protein